MIPTVLPKLFFELIISGTVGFTAFKKLYHLYPFRIMGVSLIVNLILLDQCGLKVISFHHY